ncbi:MAG: SH3 domain-containing protein [Pseudomonadota bacterium]|nr:SH3 domain-containing protein [Pseudomonadota bacterium]
MKRPLLLALLVLAASPAVARQELYRVVGIARGDQLNIRERPDADVIGAIPPNTRRLQGFGCTDNTPSRQAWCRVKYNGVVGWVRETFIRYD